MGTVLATGVSSGVGLEFVRQYVTDGAVESSYGWTCRVSKAALNRAVAAAQHDHPGAIMVAPARR